MVLSEIEGDCISAGHGARHLHVGWCHYLKLECPGSLQPNQQIDRLPALVNELDWLYLLEPIRPDQKLFKVSSGTHRLA